MFYFICGLAIFVFVFSFYSISGHRTKSDYILIPFTYCSTRAHPSSLEPAKASSRIKSTWTSSEVETIRICKKQLGVESWYYSNEAGWGFLEEGGRMLVRRQLLIDRLREDYVEEVGRWGSQWGKKHTQGELSKVLNPNRLDPPWVAVRKWDRNRAAAPNLLPLNCFVLV